MSRKLSLVLLLSLTARLVADDAQSPAQAKTARELVQQALAAEASGQTAEQKGLLDQAKAAAPDEPAVRWALGQVRVGDDWKSLEEITAAAKDSKVLQEYKKRRDASEPTIASQREIAIFCERNKLSAQAEAHWSAIAELDPEHQEARKHLGFEWQQGRWVNLADIAAQRAQAAKVASTLSKLSEKLTILAADLNKGSLTVDQARDQLTEHADAAAIPAWESIVSPKCASAALAVVGALGKMPEQAAAHSLARHALASDFPAARQEATRLLQLREQADFVPALLGELKGPWVAWREIATDGRSQLIYRYHLAADGIDKQTLRVLDDAYFLHGMRALAAGVANRATAISTMPFEQQRLIENQRIQATNDRVMQLLSLVTGEMLFDSPQDWWQWWDDKNEVYLAEGKPIELSYAFRSANISVAPPPPPPIVTGGGGGAPRPSTPTKKDCLAGGTPILTQRGPVAIERIRIGDLVFSQHPETGEVKLQPVLRTTVREPSPLVRIVIGEVVLRASGGHPFWVAGRGWLRARQLEPGMRVHGLGQSAEVREVKVEEKPTRSFNLVVANFHTYFVAPGQILSHDNSAAESTTTTVPGLK
jgi:hypothetical protein